MTQSRRVLRTCDNRGGASETSEMQLLVAFAASVAVCTAFCTYHSVEQGYVGVYHSFGRIQDTLSAPGLHFKFPWTRFTHVQITQQSDYIGAQYAIRCNTGDGVVADFRNIRIINQLHPEGVVDVVSKFGADYDRPLILDHGAHKLCEVVSKMSLHEVFVTRYDELDDVLCDALQKHVSKYTDKLEVIGANVPKPSIPQEIFDNYRKMEQERTRLVVANRTQQVEVLEAQTATRVDEERAKRATMVATEEARREAEVKRLAAEARVKEERLAQEQSAIKDATNAARIRAEADAEFYKVNSTAKANELLLTEQYLYKHKMEQLGSNQRTVYFGSSIPQYMASLMGTD